MIQRQPTEARPPLRDQFAALLVALICALCFLRGAVSTENALLPYPPEVLEPMRGTALAAGTPESDVFRGNLSMGDKYNQSLAWDRITADRLRSGEIPLWTRDIAGGVPFVPQMGQVYHPANVLLFWIPSTGVYGIWYLLHMVLFGFFAYRFMRRLGISHGPATFGMVAVILGFWTQARIHHNVMLSAVMPVFAMMSCAHHLFRCGGGYGHAALLAIGCGLSWLTGFAPGSLMCSYLVSGFAIALFLTNPRGSRLRPLLLFATGMAVGLLVASVQLLPVLMAAAETSREAATLSDLANKSLELPHLLTAIWPTLLCWPADHFYAGGNTHPAFAALALLDRQMFGAAFNFPETAFYAGLIPLLFAVSSWRARSTWFFVAVALTGLAMALGLLLPVSQFVPGVHSGDIKRFVLLFALALPVLAAQSLQRWLITDGRGVPFALFATVGIVSTGLFLAHLAPSATILDFYGDLAVDRLRKQQPGLPYGLLREWAFPGEAGHNRSVLLQGFATTSIVSLAAGLALWFRSRFTVWILCLVTAAELLWQGCGTIVSVPIERVSTPPAILEPILKSGAENGLRPRLQRLMDPKDPDRFHYAAWPNMAGFWGVEDLAAYSPLPKSRMEGFFLALEPDPVRTNEDGTPKPEAEIEVKESVVLGGAGVGALRRPESLSHPLADLIGIEWVISSSPLQLPGLEEHTVKGSPPAFHLYRRSTCLPRATFLEKAVTIREAGERLATLGTRDASIHDVRSSVILESPDAPQPEAPNPEAPNPETPNPEALHPRATGETTVEILSHRDEEVRIAVTNSASGYLRLADPYDPGWTATIDGAETEVFVADHYFRAVFLQPGEHTVVFRYDGFARVRGPQFLSLFGLLVVLVLAYRGMRAVPAVATDPPVDPSFEPPLETGDPR